MMESLKPSTKRRGVASVRTGLRRRDYEALQQDSTVSGKINQHTKRGNSYHTRECGDCNNGALNKSTICEQRRGAEIQLNDIRNSKNSSKYNVYKEEQVCKPSSNQYTHLLSHQHNQEMRCPSKPSQYLNDKRPSFIQKNISKIETKTSKSKNIQEKAKRDKRMKDTRRRRDQIEKNRVKQLKHNSGVQRQRRLKTRKQERQRKQIMVSKWTMIIILGVRMQAAIQMVKQFRQYQAQLEIEDNASRVIARQMRVLKFKLHRKRVRGAIRVLATAFLVQVKLWRESRRRSASDKVLCFLLALERDNNDTGGCLALIVKGKKWRAYRLKIIVLQRLWRRRLQIISSQVLLIDRQWQTEQKRRIGDEVNIRYEREEEKATVDNESIDNINRTRKLLKMKPLSKKKCSTREEIRNKIVKGRDFLSAGGIVPSEIRHEIISDLLKHMKYIYLDQLALYDDAYQIYEQDGKERQRRRALLVGFSGNSTVNTWVWGEASSRSRRKIEEWESKNPTYPPMKPMFHVILGNITLSLLLDIGQKYVEELRKSWNPRTMNVIPVTFNGKEIAEAHYKENAYIVATTYRNKRFLREDIT